MTQPREIYEYMLHFSFPYRYEVTFSDWERSYSRDVDGDGRALFLDLTTLGAYLDGHLVGFIQYGRTAFGFDEKGEISDAVSYPVIRNFYFDECRRDAGVRLLDEAVKALPDTADRIYAFFHYFGMSCYARHGKLFEGFDYIHGLLAEKGFTVEHENVFYSSTFSSAKQSAIRINWQDRTLGRQQYGEFLFGKDVVGGCEVHFLEQEKIAYLRWIFINDDLRGKGVGSECMSALKADLLGRGITRFDTDTALANSAAQHFYEKNDFIKEGVTRSYYRLLKE